MAYVAADEGFGGLIMKYPFGVPHMRNPIEWNWYFWDSYNHYRARVGLGILHALYRAAYYEIFHKEPPA